MTRGKVKFFSRIKGYGFISHELGDVFFHYSDLIISGFKAVAIGMIVDYELHVDSNGAMKATNVIPIAISWEEPSVIDIQRAKVRNLEDRLNRLYQDERRQQQ